MFIVFFFAAMVMKSHILVQHITLGAFPLSTWSNFHSLYDSSLSFFAVVFFNQLINLINYSPYSTYKNLFKFVGGPGVGWVG